MAWRYSAYAGIGLICCLTALAAAPVSSDLDVLRGNRTDDGFALALAPRRFEFPRDLGPHPDFRHEWWYVTGNLDSSSGERFGFELTVFRVGLVGPGDAASTSGTAPGQSVGAAGASAWRTRQVYAAHFAITDVARSKFMFADRYSRDALGLAGAQAAPFRVWLNDWLLGMPPGQPLQSAPPLSNMAWTIHAQAKGYELTLDTGALGQPVLNGDHGFSRKSSEPGAASFYYSIPRIAVHGKVVRNGIPSDVQGFAWLDREWGSGSLGATEQGWDWFAFQLRDGGTLMFYALRNRDGTRNSNSAGTWVDSSGRAQSLSTDQVSIEVSDHWASPRGGRYPSRWRVRVPAVGLDVEVRPVLADQELDIKPRYWEGAVDLKGFQGGHDTAGRGYVELVGYGE